MNGQRIGYVRVSSFDQNPERQLEHVQVDRLFTDEASGKDTQRPELQRLLPLARFGRTGCSISYPWTRFSGYRICDEDEAALALVDSWPSRLRGQGLSISTGPVVLFRATEPIG